LFWLASYCSADLAVLLVLVASSWLLGWLAIVGFSKKTVDRAKSREK